MEEIKKRNPKEYLIYLPLIQIIYPETDPFGSKPCEAPSIVTPKIGGLKLISIISSLKTFFLVTV